MQEWLIKCKTCDKKMVVQMGSFYGVGKKCIKCKTLMRPGMNNYEVVLTS